MRDSLLEAMGEDGNKDHPSNRKWFVALKRRVGVRQVH